MTTNIYDAPSAMVATDSRWSVEYLSWVIYLDDSGFEKIEQTANHVFMFAGLGSRVQEWKSWLRSNPTGAEGQPAHDKMAVCMIDIESKEVVFRAGVDITRDGALFAGTGARSAWNCWDKNRDAKRAVESAKAVDIFTGGEVKFFNVTDRSHNLYAGGASVQYSALMQQIYDRGLAMRATRDESKAIPFKLKDLAASNEELREASAKIATGELQACAPCDGMVNEWTQEQKDDFNRALAKAFGWKQQA